MSAHEPGVSAGEIAAPVAESVLKTLSPTRSTYYTPVSVATFALCWITGQVAQSSWWFVALVLFASTVALCILATIAAPRLEGVIYLEELRLARTIALSSSFITLVSATKTLVVDSWVLALHIVACSVQIIVFIAFSRHGEKRELIPRANVIQLTLILAALLGGAAYSVASSVNFAGCERDLAMCSFSITHEGWTKAQLHAMAGHYATIAIAYYTLWLLCGVALVRPGGARIRGTVGAAGRSWLGLRSNEPSQGAR